MSDYYDSEIRNGHCTSPDDSCEEDSCDGCPYYSYPDDDARSAEGDRRYHERVDGGGTRRGIVRGWREER